MQARKSPLGSCSSLVRVRICGSYATVLLGVGAWYRVDAVAGPSPADLQRDYDVEQAAVSALREQTKEEHQDSAVLQRTQQARALHVQGNLHAALEVMKPSYNLFYLSRYAHADAAYTHGRILEAMQRRGEAASAYLNGLHPSDKESVTTRLIREGLARVSSHPAQERATELARQGDFVGAVRAYEEALRDWPNDATYHSELARFAVRAKDGAKAAAAATRALALTEESSVKAGAYYNLGQAQELQQNRQAAIDAYQSALDLHEEELQSYLALREWSLQSSRAKAEEEDPPEEILATRQQMRTLIEPLRRLRAPLFPTLGKSLDGPHASLKEAHIEADDCWIKPTKRALAAPFLDVSACEVDIDSYALRIDTAAGIYLLKNFFVRFNRGDYEIASATMQQGRLVVYSKRTTGRFATVDSYYVTICGVAAGAPSCVGPIELRQVFRGYRGSKENGHSLAPVTEFSYALRLLPDDMLSIEPRKRRSDLDRTGRAKLRFP